MAAVSIDFSALFSSSPTPTLVLLPDAPRFTIAEANPAYTQMTGTGRERLIGKGVFEAFPPNPDDPAGTGFDNLRASLERAIQNQAPDTMDFQRHDIVGESGRYEERYWSPVNTPVSSPSGKIEYLLHCSQDVTAFVQLRASQQHQQAQAKTLRQQNDELAAELLRRSVALKASNADLQQQHVAMAEADRRKDEFLAMLAHELRNPLAAIHNAVHLLKREEVGSAATNYVAILQRQANTLGDLVDDLLDVSRITRGLVELRQERVDIASIAERALQSVQSLMDEKRHDVTVTLPTRPLEVVGDQVRLEQVFVNLLVNSGKYTNPCGRIALQLEHQPESVLVRVQDNGIGMTAEVIERAFTLFGQGERGLARAEGGLGIGLTIVKNLVELHGGSVEARSGGLGKGSEFIVTLPAAPAAEPAQALPLLDGHQSRQRRRILVVDDSRDIAETLALILESSGHQVAVAYDGPSALQLAEEDPPEVILLDIGLPGMDGYEVARRVRENPRMRQVVLAALTGYGQASDQERAQAAGFERHFTKPIGIEEIEAFINGSD